MQVQRRTDMMKLIVGFRNFANAPEILRDICYEPERRLYVYLLN
jgi:hypothetical protein